MKQYRPLFLILTILLSSFIAYGLWSSPFPNSEGFSAERVVEDLKVIAKEPHSVAHPEERAKVVQYLTQRLEGMGGNPKTYVYPNITSRRFTFDATNVLAEFPPLKASADTTYLMMMAHHDSRYPWKLMGDTVTALGAIDDGYGLGIILESVRQALKYRKDWHQGIKVLFTDAEEVDLQGMKAAYKYNKEIFDNVGLILNIEARGPFGPALLFETSMGNEKVIQLYADHARYPFTYSLMNVVYHQMPNGSDFNITRDSIPGMNFSAIADINHYHTDLDNIDNISKKTIGHYGEQLLPVMKEYLTNNAYSDRTALMSEEDSIFFSIPLLGMFCFSKSVYLLLNIGVIFLFFHLLSMEKNLRWKPIFKQSGILMVASLILIILGEIIAWLCALSVGARFKWFGTVQGIPFDNAVMIFSVLILAIRLIRYFRKRKDIHQNLYASMLTLMVGSIVFFFIAYRENMMFFLPLCIGTLTLHLWKTTSARVFPLLGMAIILIHAFSFVYIVAMALSIGALGLVLFLAFHYLIILIPLAHGYLADTTSNQIP